MFVFSDFFIFRLAQPLNLADTLKQYSALLILEMRKVRLENAIIQQIPTLL